ncbi:cbb3-type cytochrome c oxidase N-terminal domain-containing protein [Cerasicoccus arenae]|uniref:Cytochrome c domain-containing protein n=1 Tax=Cerasicoccus arenae TaxID=424488 RepID=A0A8J3DBA2_9BACT|nr:cbb3-type cytochrome c oxidase N-terminal domain-containing protein [Cerasicoccus arenae]MBK1857643.1 c-type cytochrome [Cerasicoccus arenae]GHC05378.1 hypothetical protein GCM10007047_22840 [Cerasicoccus arenae]
MSDPSHNTEQEMLPDGVVLKEHSYDGIQEYDQQLPRWWLLTLYGAIVFSAAYWLVSHYYMSSLTNEQRVEKEMQAINAIRLTNSIDVSNDELFWEMRHNPAFVLAGEKTFQSFCIPCHGANLEGGIGFNLVDSEWVHGAAPPAIYNTIFNGVPEKGMQAWGDMLGQKRITEVVAYILSKNNESAMRKSAASGE